MVSVVLMIRAPGYSLVRGEERYESTGFASVRIFFIIEVTVSSYVEGDPGHGYDGR
jgi:hypothetical protein